MFHTCFNVTNTAILIWFVPQMVRVVSWLLPGKETRHQDDFRLQYIQTNLVQTPEIAVLQAQKETARFAENIHQMFERVQQMLTMDDSKLFEKSYAWVEQEEDVSDRMEIEIARYLEKVGNDHLSDETKQKIRQMLREVGELESIGDACYNLARTLQRRAQSGRKFTSQQTSDLQEMMTLCDHALRQMCVVMHGHRYEHDIRETFRIENDINALRDRLKRANIVAVNNHQYDYAVGTMFGDLVGELEKLGDYVVNVVQARFGK